MKKKKSVRVKAERGFGPRHMMNAQEGSEAVPSDLPSPPEWVEEARRRVAAGQGMKNLTPGILGGLGEAGSQLAGMSKEEVAKLAISMLAGGEDMPLGEPGAVPLRKWSSWDTAQKAGGGRGPIKSDGVGNYYEQIGEHATTNPDVQHVIVKPVEKPVYDFNKWQEQVGGEGEVDPPLPKAPKTGLENTGGEIQSEQMNSQPHEGGPPSNLAYLSPDEAIDLISEQHLGSNPPVDPWEKYFDHISEAYEKGFPIKAEGADQVQHPSGGNLSDLLKNQGWTQKGDTYYPPGYSKGTRKVAVAKGFGPMHAENSKEGEDLTQVNTDTVPAMLTPRESVLNRNASELAGRDNIEKLNAEGNQLAKRGVDLAAGGESDVGLSDILKTYQAGGDLTPEEIARVIAVLKGGGGASEPSVATQVPRYGQYHDELPDLSNPNREQKGTSDMKSKPKQSKPQSGSPYVQAFQNLMPKGGAPVGYQGGGDSVPGMGGGLGARDQYGRQFSNRDASGSYGQGNGVPGAGVPGGPFGTRNDTGPGVIGGPMGGGPFPGRGPGGVYPGAMPGMQGPGTPPTQQGPFQGRGPGGVYPSGPMATPLADGSSNVGPIGTPPQGEQAYGPPVNLTAPQIQQLAKQTGISPTQIMGLMKAFQGGKDIYNSVGTGGGYANQSPSAGEDFGNPNYIGLGTPSYQGGISDIGYPPFVAPSANYDGNRGGWLGPYDPSFMIQRYAGGTSYVSPFR